MNLWEVQNEEVKKNNTIINSQQLAGGCAEKSSVIIMCTLQHSVSFVVTLQYDS